MTRTPFTLAAGALAAAAVALPAAPADASRSTVRLGIADNDPATFTSADWKRVGAKRTRYIVKWNAIDDPGALAQADAFMAAAKANDVDVLLHFSTDDYTPRAARLPGASEFRRKVGALVDRWWDDGVREFGVWNEANDRTQPTYRSPARAATFFQELWRMLDDRDRCGSSVTAKCRVVALDVLDGRTRSQQGNARSYIRRFYGALGRTYRSRARFVGIHNYSDTNRNGTSGTKNAITETRRHNRRAIFWLTETGGVVKLGDTGSFRCDPDSPASVRAAEARADRATTWMFRLTKRYRSSVDRLYVYQWTGANCRQRFDAGLVRSDGSRRPAFYEVLRQMRDSSILKP
ncbi:hypothetical protein [Conexibacter sp. SYSU D00693]|uniref:hypothetical protein n=1 Tax=Conexibacter sp. SYSU D00693 TaxID=2812560 RepID=UPI00196B0790|nr:hypothetical protein [Conexibacter sp. SYSU D00693]